MISFVWLASYLLFLGKCIKTDTLPMGLARFFHMRIRTASGGYGHMWHKVTRPKLRTNGRYFKWTHGNYYGPPHLTLTHCNQFTQYQYLHRETGEYLRFVDIHPWPAHRLADLVPDSLWAERMLEKLVQLNC